MKNKIIIYITTAIILLFVGILIPTNNIYAMFTPGGGVGFSNGTKNSSSSSSTPDDVMKDADDFIKQGENTADIDTDKLHDTSNFLYNLLFSFWNSSSSNCWNGNRNNVYGWKCRRKGKYEKKH